MRHARAWSIVLLLAGIGLVMASCVPVAQTWWQHAERETIQRLVLAPDGEPATLSLSRARTVEPVLVLSYPPRGVGAVAWSLIIEDPGGAVLLERDGKLAREPGAGAGQAPTLERRLPPLTIPAGRSSVRLNAAPAAGVEAALRLMPPSPGLLPVLFTSVMLALAGCLAACLGALQWVRAAAADPAVLEQASGDAGRAWVVGCHLAGLLGYLIPLGHLLGPLAVWLAKRDSVPGVEEAGRNAMNFQLSVTLYVVAALLLSLFLVGILLLFAIAVFHFSMVLMASLRAQRGEPPGYPLTMTFIQQP